MSGAAETRVHALVSGRVQGVGYRASTHRTALTLGLEGWVRNLADGRVELVAEGSRESVETLVAWCRSGPAFARVTDVEVTWQEPVGEAPFTIR